MKKQKVPTYQIKYLVTAIISQEVVAEDFESAKVKTDAIMKKNIFANGLETIVEQQEFIGFDNLSEWDKLSR